MRRALAALLHGLFWADSALAILGFGTPAVVPWPFLAACVALSWMRHPEYLARWDTA
jgi:hypothetical protein